MARKRIQQNPLIQSATLDVLRQRGKLGKQIRMKPPKHLERQYLKAILQIQKKAREIVRALFISQLPNFQSQALDSIVADGYGEDIARAMDNVKVRFWANVQTDDLERLATNAGRQIELFSTGQIERSFQSAIGISPAAMFPDADLAIEAFVKDNVKLIESIPQKYFAEIEQTALRNFRAGRRAADWQGELVKRYKVSQSRAALIARDQTNKFNSELNRVRQQALGVRTYTWRTVGDERVRTTHEEIDGETFAWEGQPKPPEGHPGEPINCRCSADPDIESVLTGSQRPK